MPSVPKNFMGYACWRHGIPRGLRYNFSSYRIVLQAKEAHGVPMKDLRGDLLGEAEAVDGKRRDASLEVPVHRFLGFENDP
jgi:hypothetical protein